MSILTNTEVDEVYQVARKIAISLVSRVIKTNKSNEEICRSNDYEHGIRTVLKTK